ncbi:MAG: hypothetical protein WDO18_14600 [Acidobacteriota bacterium]
MKSLQLAILFALCSAAFGQSIGSSSGPFSGPSILSSGSGGVGRRGGEDVDLRFYGGVNAVYDTGLVPFAVKSGELVQPGGIVGIEAGIGAYGSHRFRRSVIGLDYSGNFRHYADAPNYDGANQQFILGYTLQKGRRLLLDFVETAGTQSFGTAIGTDPSGENTIDTNSILFDNRTSYLQTGMTARYLLSNRTAVSVGGTGYTVRRQAHALVGVNGYSLQGGLQHQLTRKFVVGVTYQHIHYDFPKAFGESDINLFMGSLGYQFARSWMLRLSAGAFSSEVQGVENTTLDPTLAALLGVGSVQTTYYKTNILPVSQLAVTKAFRKSTIGAHYDRTVTPGNGVYLTSRQESYGMSYSHSAIGRLSLSFSAGATKLNSLGQNLQRYTQYSGKRQSRVSDREVHQLHCHVLAPVPGHPEQFISTQQHAHQRGHRFQPGFAADLVPLNPA